MTTLSKGHDITRISMNRIIEIAREMNIEIGADASKIEHKKAVLEKHFDKAR